MRVYIKLKVSWLRAFLWCQTSRDRVNSRHVRTHEKNSGDAVRRLGTIIQSIFCAQSGASIRLTFGNGPVRVGTQGLFRLCLKTFVAPFLPPDWPPLGLRGWLHQVLTEMDGRHRLDVSMDGLPDISILISSIDIFSEGMLVFLEITTVMRINVFNAPYLLNVLFWNPKIK